MTGWHLHSPLYLLHLSEYQRHRVLVLKLLRPLILLRINRYRFLRPGQRRSPMQSITIGLCLSTQR
jgi:hypothetical protein